MRKFGLNVAVPLEKRVRVLMRIAGFYQLTNTLPSCICGCFSEIFLTQATLDSDWRGLSVLDNSYISVAGIWAASSNQVSNALIFAAVLL